MNSGGRNLDSDPNKMIPLPPLTGMVELTGYHGAFLPDLAAPSLLLGGRLAIDFANIPSYPGAPAQHLSWEELIVFLQAAGIVSGERGSSLLALSGSNPDAAQTLLSRSVRLRDALRMAFGAMVKKDAIAREWTEPINEILRITEGHDELVSDGIAWKMEFVRVPRRRLLWKARKPDCAFAPMLGAAFFSATVRGRIGAVGVPWPSAETGTR
jgi:hypothetical protein